jgi:ArsR family transcriptional regulator
LLATVSLLRALAEPTRLRIAALCAATELTVGDLTRLLGQSQPRVSRHLKLMVEAGLLERHAEGAYVLLRLSDEPLVRRLVMPSIEALPHSDATIARDRARLAALRQSRAAAAQAFVDANAARWDAERALHVPEAEVERRLLQAVPPGRYERLLDLGTGTGRMLELLAPRVGQAVGLDRSREMLAIARGRIAAADLGQCTLRLGDLHAVPFADAAFDLVVAHMALHFVDDPSLAIAEAARVLAPGGRLLIVDFDRHTREELRAQHAHVHLGLAPREILGWFEDAAIEALETVSLPGSPLTVMIWQGQKPAGNRRRPAPSSPEAEQPPEREKVAS